MVKKRASKTKKRKPAKAKRKKPSKHVELRPVRRQVELVVRRLESVSEPNERVRKVLMDMRNCLASIGEACGPVMSVPLV
jgi:hypothetical protein